MPIGILFWMLMILWLLFDGWFRWNAGDRIAFGGSLLLWIILALLGWHDFGSILK